MKILVDKLPRHASECPYVQFAKANLPDAHLCQITELHCTVGNDGCGCPVFTERRIKLVLYNSGIITTLDNGPIRVEHVKTNDDGKEGYCLVQFSGNGNYILSAVHERKEDVDKLLNDIIVAMIGDQKYLVLEEEDE